MGKHLAGLPSGRLHRRCFVDLRSTEIVPLTNNSRDCTTGWQNQSDRQTGMPSLQSCNAVEVDGTRASNHYSKFLYPFLYLKCLISTINAHTSYLSQTPQTCLCKNFLSGVNFSILSEKNAYI